MTIPVVVLVAAAVIAGYTDLRTRRIPNWLTGAVALFGLSHHFVKSGGHGLWISLGGVALGAGLILLPMLIPYAKGGIGGGDVKFIAAVGSIVGAAGVFVVFIVAAGVGAIQCLIALWRQAATGDRPVTVPYGVALSVGTLVVTVGSLLSR
ncbi:MAG: A24 family peptidase [Acidobacteriota bacterium]|nr:A24 family peptidase [Blastocatellia bacterium]MDW8240869.1 A24 family peptidase [Acidobacteriota bacterium]